MKYLTLEAGAESLKVSKLALGTARSMAGLSKAAFFELLDLFVAAGGNCLDTAREYFNGGSEEVIGEWLAERRQRHSLVISTKGGHPRHDASQRSRLSRKDLEEDLHASLKALRTDRVDIYWLHKDDPQHPVEDIVETLNGFIKAGQIRLMGCSNWAVARIEQANAYARQAGLTGFAASQIQWSLADPHESYLEKYGARMMTASEYDWYLQKQMPVFAFGPQAQGFFVKAAAQGLEAVSAENRRFYESEPNLARLERVKAYAQLHHAPLAAVVLGYVLCNKLPGVAIIGASQPEQLQDSLHAADFSMEPAEADQLYAG